MKRNWVFPAACAVILALAALLTVLSERDEGTYISIHSIERTSGKSFPALSEISGGVRLYVNGERAPYDHASNTYFIPQESDTEEITGDISIEAEEGYTYFLFSREGVLKTDAIKNSIGYNVYGIRGGECVSSKIIFTALPIIRIHAEGEIASDEEYVSGRISVFEAKDGGVFVKTHSMGIRVRGNTSQRFPKKSYQIRLTDQAGEKFHAPFLSLRSDDDWILNPMYADDTKIREMLAYELWDKMNSSGMNANSSDMEHSEIFLEDNYHGLYALQERVDYKQVDGDKKADILYKIAANDMPTAEELIKCASREVCRAFEMQSDVFRGSAEDIWSPAADYMAVISGGEPSLGAETSYENAADFGLWAMLTQAHDCHFRNAG
ncbi:MAG: CotH kinase family protein [Clostridia bacterium]|nr:CotH kinase family protein [Clostridia bacterium]